MTVQVDSEATALFFPLILGARMVHDPAVLAKGKRLGVHCTGDWVGHMAGLNG